MDHSKRNIALSLAVGLWFFAVGVCDTNDSQRPTVNIKFTLYADNPLPGLFYEDPPVSKSTPPKRHEVAAQSHTRSDVYSYRGPTPLEFYAPGPIVDGVATKVLAASVDIPPSIRTALIFFVRQKDGHNYRQFLLDDSLVAHPIATVRVVNLTNYAYSGRVGGQGVNIDAGFSVLPIFPMQKSLSASLATVSDHPFPVLDQRIEVPENTRLLLVLLPPFRERTFGVRARFVFDTHAPPPSPAK